MIKFPVGLKESLANSVPLLIHQTTQVWRNSQKISLKHSKQWKKFLLQNLCNLKIDKMIILLNQMMLSLNSPLKISLIRTFVLDQFQESLMVMASMIEHQQFLVEDKQLKVMMVLSTGINKPNSNWNIRERLLRGTMPSIKRNWEENKPLKKRRLWKNDQCSVIWYIQIQNSNPLLWNYFYNI